MLFNKLLQGERVYLAGVSSAELPLHVKWFSDVEIQKLMAYRPVFPQTIGETERRFQRAKDSGQMIFTIRLIGDDTPIGYFNMKGFDWRNRSAQVGISIGESDHWGHGYGTEAMQIALRYAFLELNLHRIELEVIATNERAVRSYEKVGFQREALKRQVLFRDGAYQDLVVMGILRDEWR